jgi:hypothetical protein
VQPPEPAPTTTKSNVSVNVVSPVTSFRGDAEHRTRNLEVPGSLRAPERLLPYDMNRINFSSRAILPP